MMEAVNALEGPYLHRGAARGTIETKRVGPEGWASLV